MKEFATAVEREPAVDEEAPITFLHDGREVTFYQPTPGHFTLLSALSAAEQNDQESFSTFIAMFFELMDEDTKRYFKGRLLNRTDTFGLDGEGGIFDIWEYLSEQWSARPTKQPSDYQPPQRATGKRSTATTRAKASTSSRSRSTATSR